MKNKKLALKLIQEDLKHHYLLHQLQKAGFEHTGSPSINLLPIIADLLLVPPAKRDQWTEEYLELVEQEVASNTSQGDFRERVDRLFCVY